MTNVKRICPKCKSAMIEGNYSGNSTFWLEENQHDFIQGSGKKIISYACEQCGYLESYVKK